MRTVLFSKLDELYLQKCALDLNFAYGIIVGQQAEAQKYVVVHLAKNGEEDADLPTPSINESQEDAAIVAEGPQTLVDVDTQALTNQWVSACKMIPGSFAVLGVFITGKAADLVGEDTFKTAKKLLYDVNHLLVIGNNLCCSVNEMEDPEYLFLAYSTDARKVVCKAYTNTANGGSFTPMDVRFVEKPFEWYAVESSYELSDIFPILETAKKINIEHQFQRTIESVKQNLAASEIFLQNESVDNQLTFESYARRKNTRRQSQPIAEEWFKATIFLPVKCQVSKEYPVKVREFHGTIRFSGVISSRIWCNPKNTIADVKRFVCTDILRSLAARIQVYCDGLTEPNITGDAVFISEPPRRVYFNVPTCSAPNPIQFSEYIFRGEDPTVAVAQAKQVLDLDVNAEQIVADLEGVPEDDSFSDLFNDSPSPASSIDTAARDLTRTMYILGITVSLLVLLISVLLHFLMWN